MNGNSKLHLARVVEMVDRVVDLTIDLLVHHTNNSDQLVLNATREQALRQLQTLMHEEYQSQNPDAERFWRLASSVLGTVLVYVLEALSESITYQSRRGRSIRPDDGRSRSTIIYFMEA